MEASARVRDRVWCGNPAQTFLDKSYKIILIGDSGTGKSQLVSRFCYNEFSRDFLPTVIMDHARKTLIDRKVSTQIWDMAGRDIFRVVTSGYYKYAVGVIVVYDITKLRSFEHASEWIERLRKIVQPESPQLLLVGNKLDLRHQRSVETKEGERLAREHNALFIETSALDATNVTKAFTQLVDHVTDKIAQTELQKERTSAAGLQNGAKVLTDTRPGQRGINRVVQTQPSNKFTLRKATQACVSKVKEQSFKLPCCFD